MIFGKQVHNFNFYNILLSLSRSIFFYKKVNLPDNFETRIVLMFIHFSILMIIFKKKGKKFEQKIYDSLFANIENNLRELGFGDVTVNKKMKDFNKLLYDILLKIELTKQSRFTISHDLISSYFIDLKDIKSNKYQLLEDYFSKFYDFCFEKPLNSVVEDAINFKY